MYSKEFEVRFLEIDKEVIIQKLHLIGAKDCGDELLSEIIFYDKEFKWRDGGQKIVKLRTNGRETTLTYKHRKSGMIGDTEEIEIEVSDFKKAKIILEKSGLIAFREQEKRRHKFILEGITFDIDTWPGVPTYLEIESDSEDAVKNGARKLELNWDKAVTDSPRQVIESLYNIPVGSLNSYKFSEFKKND